MADGKCNQELVERAFALGWHVCELYHFEAVASISLSRGKHIVPTLPGIGSLGIPQRKGILIRQVRNDIPAVWSQTLEGPSADQLNVMVDTIENADPGAFAAAVEVLHEALLGGLTVANFRLGKAYGLGRALADTAIIPQSVAPLAPGGSSAKFRNAIEAEFEAGRVFTLRSWLHDLRDCFAAYAADAVATTLGGWSIWMIRPTLGGSSEIRWSDDDSGRLDQALRRQGDVWRGLLSGEKDPQSMLRADYYFAAMASVVRKVAGLAWEFIGTGIGFFLVVIVIITALALYFEATSRNTTGVLAAVIGLLSSLGVTSGSAWGAVQKAFDKAETPLWEAEVGAAVAQATWHNPAPLGSIEEIQLMLNLGSKPDLETWTRVRHPALTALRNFPVGRIGLLLIIVALVVAVFGANAARIETDAAFFLPALCVVGLLAVIDAWDLLIASAARQTAPYLALPERIELPAWILESPIAQYLPPAALILGLLAGHLFWH